MTELTVTQMRDCIRKNTPYYCVTGGPLDKYYTTLTEATKEYDRRCLKRRVGEIRLFKVFGNGSMGIYSTSRWFADRETNTEYRNVAKKR